MTATRNSWYPATGLVANWGQTYSSTYHQDHYVIGHQSRTCRPVHEMACEAIYIRIILEELGHKQPPTPLQTDNTMADAVINGIVQPKWVKAMNMGFHWLQDQECQQQFCIYWWPGKMNYANYWTKHHPGPHHRNMWEEFLTPHIVLEMLRIEQQHYASCAAWRSDHNNGTWQGCDDLSLVIPAPLGTKDRPQNQAPLVVVA